MLQIDRMLSFSSWNKTDQVKARTIRKNISMRGKKAFDSSTSGGLTFCYNDNDFNYPFILLICWCRIHFRWLFHNVPLISMFKKYLNIYTKNYILFYWGWQVGKSVIEGSHGIIGSSVKWWTCMPYEDDLALNLARVCTSCKSCSNGEIK